jgi:hypothetical protein
MENVILGTGVTEGFPVAEADKSVFARRAPEVARGVRVRLQDETMDLARQIAQLPHRLPDHRPR